MKKLKSKTLIILITLIIVIIISIALVITKKLGLIGLKKLPLPEITGGSRGELGIDKNINEDTIDEYLNRPDSVYRDMRMLEDPGNYEAIGGDRFLSGYIKGFEVIPLPYIIPVTGLPSEVGETYTGTTLFYNDNGRYIANYKESMDIIEKIFPKDKVIFLMCGGGGYSGMTKNFLVSLGWDETKIYNIGGYWYYKGKNSINIKKELNGNISYDFEKVTYHDIEFEKLTRTDNYRKPIVKVAELKINTSKIELEEGTSFKLNVIVLPNDATNKELKWTSSDESIAIVTNEGIVSAEKEGKTIITAESIDDSKTISCEVIVKKAVKVNIKLDNISKEAKEFASYNIDKIYKEFDDITKNSDGSYKEMYYTVLEDGSKKYNDLWEEENDKYEKNLDEAYDNRVNIINKLSDDKKSFIILIHNKKCAQEEYSVSEGAQKILKQNNYSYLYIDTVSCNGDKTLEKSKLYADELKDASIIIVENGEIFAYMDPNINSVKSDKEAKIWLSKYIKIK